MNVRLLTTFVALVSLAAFGTAQVSKDKTEASRRVLNKVRQIDHLNHLLPLVLTKAQINAILPAIEKARAAEDKVTLNEHNELVKLEAQIDSQIAKGVKEGKVPDQDFNKRVAKLFSDFATIRQIVAEENTDLVFEVVKKTLDAGQFKAAANTFNPKEFDPSAKPAEMSDDDKVKLFIKAVFMDWTSYDILLKLAARQ